MNIWMITQLVDTVWKNERFGKRDMKTIGRCGDKMEQAKYAFDSRRDFISIIWIVRSSLNDSNYSLRENYSGGEFDYLNNIEGYACIHCANRCLKKVRTQACGVLNDLWNKS